MQSEQLAAFVADKLDDLKGKDIVTLDIRDKANFADFMVVCTGNSNRHVKSLADHVLLSCREQGVNALGMEGKDVGEWVLVDLDTVICHVMVESTRAQYQLEQLWSHDPRA